MRAKRAQRSWNRLESWFASPPIPPTTPTLELFDCPFGGLTLLSTPTSRVTRARRASKGERTLSQVQPSPNVRSPLPLACALREYAFFLRRAYFAWPSTPKRVRPAEV